MVASTRRSTSLTRAKKELDEALFNTSDRDTLRNLIREIAVKSKREQILERVVQLLEEQDLMTDEEKAKQIFNLLRNDPIVSSLIKN